MVSARRDRGVPTRPGMSPGGRSLRLDHRLCGRHCQGLSRGLQKPDGLVVGVCRRLGPWVRFKQEPAMVMQRSGAGSAGEVGG